MLLGKLPGDIMTWPQYVCVRLMTVFWSTMWFTPVILVWTLCNRHLAILWSHAYSILRAYGILKYRTDLIYTHCCKPYCMDLGVANKATKLPCTWLLLPEIALMFAMFGTRKQMQIWYSKVSTQYVCYCFKDQTCTSHSHNLHAESRWPLQHCTQQPFVVAPSPRSSLSMQKHPARKRTTDLELRQRQETLRAWCVKKVLKKS